MTGRRRVGTCARCGREEPIVARRLGSRCYVVEKSAGRLALWPRLDGRVIPTHAPVVDTRPDTATADRCDWCRAPLTRSRKLADPDRLYEVYTIAGRVIAACFEGCPAPRLPRREVSRG